MAIAAVLALLVLPATASDREPAEAPAFQGHAAEMLMRDEASERRRRMLFFEDVDLELGGQGLPCDHLAGRRPAAIAGPGHVVILTIQAARPMRLRVWLPPGGPTNNDEALMLARMLAVQTGVIGEVQVQDIQRFLWCR